MPNLILRSRFLCRYDKYLSTIREFVFQDRPNIVKRYRTVTAASTLFANIHPMTTWSLQCALYAFISHARPLRDARRTELHVRSPRTVSSVSATLTTTAFLHTLLLHLLILFYRAYLKTQAGHAAVFSGAFNPGQLASHQKPPQ
jgi:hypothetical protein